MPVLARLLAVLTIMAVAPSALAAGPRQPRPGNIRLPSGYLIEPIAINLSVPTTAIFSSGHLLVAESGWANTAKPRILRIAPDGSITVVASEGLQGPVTGLLEVDGTLFVSHRGLVSVVEEDGRLRHIVSGLPSGGDHQNNNLVAGPDGKIYLGQGTVTNSGVVGVDNYIFGWLSERPALHEVPCKDITLVGRNFVTEDPLTAANDQVTTGAYKPFGTPSASGEVIKGSPKCGGSILRFNPDGSDLEVVAWGLRNPFGLEFDSQGALWATFHGADVRGSRSIFNDPDYLVRVEEGAWYGWPDFYDRTSVTDRRFHAPGTARPEPLWQHHPSVAAPFTTFETHEGANGLAFSPGGQFGFAGDAFVAMFGTFTPVTTGVNIQPAGFRIVRVEMKTGEVFDFASNRVPGPSYVNRVGGFDRPSDLIFAPDGGLYVVDWGSSTLTKEGLKLAPQTGILWRIYPQGVSALRPQGPLVVDPAPVPEAQRKPEVRNVPELYRMIAPTLAMIGGLLLLVAVGGALLWRRARRTRA